MLKSYFETKLGKLYHGDGLKILPMIEPIDLVVTSPPYDKLRKYEKYKFDFKNTANRLYELIKSGGIIVWVIGDQTIDGSETGTSFRQALYFKEIGFNLHDTMIYEKDSMPLTHNRYEQSWEFMFIFSKGKPKTFNFLMDDCKHSGEIMTGTRRHDLHNLEKLHGIGKVVQKKKIRNNIWKYITGFNKTTKDRIAFEHPAIFPEALARDHILSWSNEGDIVLDNLCGSGTTLKVAEQLNRRWIGIEISEKYCEIAAKRIEIESKRNDMKFTKSDRFKKPATNMKKFRK